MTGYGQKKGSTPVAPDIPIDDDTQLITYKGETGVKIQP